MNRSEARSPRSRRLSSVLLNLGAGAGLICILAAIASVGFGIKPLVFRSGSMEPAISTGALGLAKTVNASQLAPRDIVSVRNAQGVRVTHRVETIERSGYSAVLTLKGDANENADAEPYTVTEADRVFFDVPGVGYLITWLSGPIAIFLGGVLAGVLLMIAFRRKPSDASAESSDEPPAQAARPTKRGGQRSMTPVAVLLAIACTTGIGASGVENTQAAFTDDASAGSGGFSTTSTAVPNFQCGTLGVLSVRFTWTTIPGARYRLNLNGTLIGLPAGTTSYTTVAVISLGSAYLQAIVDYPNSTSPATSWVSQPSQTRNYTVAVVSLCS